MRYGTTVKFLIRAESGFSLLESVVALAVLALVGLSFLYGLTTTSKAASVSDERSTALSLAQIQMEWTQNAEYSTSGYATVPLPDTSDYNDYSVNVTAQSLETPDDGIQKITVTVNHSRDQLVTLEGFKVE